MILPFAASAISCLDFIADKMDKRRIVLKKRLLKKKHKEFSALAARVHHRVCGFDKIQGVPERYQLFNEFIFQTFPCSEDWSWICSKHRGLFRHLIGVKDMVTKKKKYIYLNEIGSTYKSKRKLYVIVRQYGIQHRNQPEQLFCRIICQQIDIILRENMFFHQEKYLKKIKEVVQEISDSPRGRNSTR